MRQSTSTRLLFIAPAVLVTAGVILFSTCRGGKGDDDDSGGGSEDATALAGSWTTGCVNDATRPSYYTTDTRSFDGSSFSTAYDTYSDKDCKTVVMSQQQAGSFAIGTVADNEDTATWGPAQQLDITVGAIFITLNTDALVSAYNERKICGGGWQKAAKRQIRQSECDPDNTANADDIDMIYDIFAVKAGRLYFGKKNSGSSGNAPETRPTLVDDSKVFERS
jgi:hypothetical protein